MQPLENSTVYSWEDQREKANNLLVLLWNSFYLPGPLKRSWSPSRESSDHTENCCHRSLKYDQLYIQLCKAPPNNVVYKICHRKECLCLHQQAFCLVFQLWKFLKPNTPLESRISKQWCEIGFQGDDPKTDFRGMGLLGLYNLQ